ncbi:MAG: winged helix-turn-helix domain-containing protein [Candidatus Bathyarchaeia archaeon]
MATRFSIRAFPSISKERRNSLEIIEDILNVASEGANITEIVYKANLNFVRAKRYINFLLEEKLLAKVEQDGNHVYKTTVRGTDFIDGFQALRRIV